MIQDVEMPRRSLKERQRQEREKLILQASEDILSEKGYQDTSMDEIAAQVGIAKGTLYLHFASKEDLVVALLEREMGSFLEAVDTTIADALKTAVTTREALEQLLSMLYTGLLGKRFQLLASLIDSSDIRLRLMERKEHVQHMKEHMLRAISQLLEQGKATGEFDTSIPTDVMLALFFSLLTKHNSELYSGYANPDELVTHLIHFYFKGIDA